MTVQQKDVIGSAKGCKVSMANINVDFLNKSREHFKMPAVGHGGKAVFGSPVLNHNDGLLLLKSISLDLTPQETLKELTTMNATTENHSAEISKQSVPPRLLSVEDIAKAKKISESYVYAILKKLAPEVAMRNGKQNLYSSDVLEMFPERQRRIRRIRRMSATQQPGATVPTQQQPTSATTPAQQYAEGSLLERMAHLEQTIAAQNSALESTKEILTKMSAAFTAQTETIQQQQDIIAKLSKILGV